MIREYIGARYVPKFMGNYDATQSYEALCVVDNGLGTSYISKIPTPPGTPLTDTVHWALYGASSGAIIHLQDQIDRLDSFGQLKGKTIAIFGASNEIASYTQNVNWVDELATILSDYASVVNKSVAGRGIIQAITDYNNDPDQADYDIIIFCCTKNQYNQQIYYDVAPTDVWAPTNIDIAIDSLNSHKTIKQTIYFASCTPYKDSNKAFPMCIYDGVVKRAAARNGFSTIDMHKWLGQSDENSYWTTWDGIHYKAEVAPIFANRCIKALLAGGEEFSNYSMKLTQVAVWNWLTEHCTVNSNLSISYNTVGAVLYCDVDLNMFLYLEVENTGSEIPANTMLIDTSGVSSIITMPSWTVLERTNALGNIKITNRAGGIRTEVPIPAGTHLLLTFGTVDASLSV